MKETNETGRLRELAERLVDVGPKAAHVSASECHEIAEGLIALLDAAVRARDAAHAVFDRVNEGDVEIIHGTYDASHCGSCDPSFSCFATSIPCRKGEVRELDCPEDDTCECASQAAFKLLSKSTHEIEAIVGQRQLAKDD